MFNLNKKLSGFSLIELVIVIIILGIIAAIAIPRIGTASRGAGESTLKGSLNTLRTAIDRYYVEHLNTYPADKGDGANNRKLFNTFRNQLTLYSNAEGVVSADLDPAFPCGPYIRVDIPDLSVGANAGSNDVMFKETLVPLIANPVNGKGWMFNVKTGEIIANATEIGTEKKSYDTY